MYAATGGPNMKWGEQILNGEPGTTATPLATALALSLNVLYSVRCLEGITLQTE